MPLAWIGGHDQAVAQWAAEQFQGKLNFWSMHSAFGIGNEDGHLVGAALFSDYYPGGNVELTFVGPGTLTRYILNQICYHAFVTLGASRITCKTRPSNSNVIRLLKKAGFKWEGKHSSYFGPGKDDAAVLFSFPVKQATRWARKH